MEGMGSAFKVGTVIADKYRVIRSLGSGGFSEVFEVEHLHLAGQRLALKLLDSRLARDPQRKERFVREVRVALKLVHPNIVTIRDFAATDEVTYYTMDLVAGKPLSTVLKELGAVESERALKWTRQVLSALEVAHELGIVHRDVKPDNVILELHSGGREVCKLLDFGIAKVLMEESHLTVSEGIIGTLEYISPEQASGQALDHRSDLYSVGAMLYHLLSGRPPFLSETPQGYILQHAMSAPPPFSESAPGRSIPSEVESIVMKALEKEPEKRFQNATEMIEAVDSALGPYATEAAGRSGLRRSGSRAGGADRAIASAETVTGKADEIEARSRGMIEWSRPLEGQLIEKYRIQKVLGEGAFGVVCLAEHTMMGRRVALKLLRPDMGADRSFLQRFRREAQIASSLDHPAITTIFDYGEVAGTCFIAMEFLEGETLASKLKREGPQPLARAWELLAPVFSALEVAHARGVVHRDLKPANIMVLRDGRVKVLDYGIAKTVRGGGPALTRIGTVLGTPLYISPEQAAGASELDARADLYAMGVILFEVLTGRPPFTRKGTAELLRAHIAERPPRLGEARPGEHFPEALEAIVARLLAKRPEERYKDARSVAASLAEVCGAHVAGATARPPARGFFEVAGTAAPTGALGGASGAAIYPVTAAGTAPGALAPATAGIAPVSPAVSYAARLVFPGLQPNTYFLFATPRLPFGRAKPGSSARPVDNVLVLRLLPCRSQQVDPQNFKLTNEISGHHGEFFCCEGAPFLVDRSSRGTWLDGVRMPKDVPMQLGAEFELNLAGVLELRGRIFPKDAGPRKPLEALRLERVSNAPGHAYVWVLERARLGPGEAIEIPEAAGSVHIEHGALYLETARGVAPLAPGEIAIGSLPCWVGTASPQDQLEIGGAA